MRTLPGPDEKAAAAAAAREAELTKPPGALGRLEELSAWLCAWQGSHPPRADRPRLCVFAGNHGVAAQEVSAYPTEVTAQMVRNFKAGGAAINQMCRVAGAEMRVHEMALEAPTADFTQGPAMCETDCVDAIAYGMETVGSGTNLLCLGEMGIANTTSAAAICCALFGGHAVDWVGPGTGLDDVGLSRKARVVASAIAKHRGAMTDPFEVMRHLGGKELAAICGAILAARMARVPVLLDGFGCTAAAAVLDAVNPASLDHCQVAHVSAEPGHRLLLKKIGKRALLDLGMRLGEGTGAVLAMSLAASAVACHTGMATFADAGVSTKVT